MTNKQATGMVIVLALVGLAAPVPVGAKSADTSGGWTFPLGSELG